MSRVHLTLIAMYVVLASCAEDSSVSSDPDAYETLPTTYSGYEQHTYAAGKNFALAIKDGRVWAWGDNASGQLGNGTTSNAKAPVIVPNMSNVISVSAGLATSYALTSDGYVYAWGKNASYQLSNGTTTNSSTPVQIKCSGTAISGIVAIAAGGSHALAIKYASGNNSILAWGSNSSGQLGNKPNPGT